MSLIPRSRTIPQLVNELACTYATHEAVVGSGQRLTYLDLQTETLRVARVLYSLNVCAGDKVAILMGNRPEWISCALAIASLGAVAVPLNTWATPSELEYLIQHSDSTYVIATPTFLKANYGDILQNFEPLSARFPLFRGVLGLGVACDALPACWTPLFDGVADVNPVNDTAIARAYSAVQPTDIALMLFTSGSTAKPKGVLLNHVGLIENSWNTGERQHLTAHDRLWLAVSLFWGMASATAMWNLLAHGGCIVLQDYFEVREALRLIEAERCTVFYGTPNMVQALFEHPDRATRDLSSLRTGGTSGTPDMMARVMALGVTDICNIYGLTETHGHTHMSDSHESAVQRMGTLGKVMPGTVQKVVAPDGTEVPVGTVGELMLKGYITPGYYKQDEQTAQSFDADGYFKTGDLVCLDADGYLQFRGRLKELIKSGGINVSPLEVEFVLKAHPSISMVQVVGVPDDTLNEIVAAAIVLKEGAVLTAEDIIDFCKPKVAAYKVPRRIAFITETELPLTTTGKIQKNLIAGKIFGNSFEGMQ